MYAVAEIGGKQYIIEKGDTIIVEKLPLDISSEYTIDKVLMLKTDEGVVKLGTPYLDDVKITAEVVDQVKSKKIIVLRKGNPKKNWKRKYGHRQNLTLLKIKDIII
jgi:large subunit ribosomal protein L21